MSTPPPRLTDFLEWVLRLWRLQCRVVLPRHQAGVNELPSSDKLV